MNLWRRCFNSRLREEATIARGTDSPAHRVSTHASVRRRRFTAAMITFIAAVSTHASVRRRPGSVRKTATRSWSFNSRLREEATWTTGDAPGGSSGFNSRLREEATIGGHGAHRSPVRFQLTPP